MKILVINAGSSSLKFKLFKMQDESCLGFGHIEAIGKESSSVTLELKENILHKHMPVSDHVEALNILFDLLVESGLIVSLDELYAVGHRVVHGGSYFSEACLIDENVLERIGELIPLAPLHNSANISGILAVREHYAQMKQVAVFDTAFHQSIPSYASQYALPRYLYEEENVRRFGFHGTSHAYMLKQASGLLGKSPQKTSIISLHLGNGASICAIQNGKSIDTSMGMTPLEGLVMGSRSGDIDPGIFFYLHRHKGYSVDEIDDMLNQESGLLGVCGENDMRLILQKAKDDPLYRSARDLFVYRIRKYIGAYMAVLERVDAIVFTGGIGKNSAEIRALSLKDLQVFGIVTDTEKNEAGKSSAFSFHDKGSRIKLFAIQTDEELEIALQTKEVLVKSSL